MRFPESRESTTPPNRRREALDERIRSYAGGQSSAGGPTTGRASGPDERSDSFDAFDSLVVVSNRQPYRHEYDDADPATDADGGVASEAGGSGPDGTDVTVDTPSGGLTAGLDPVVRRTGGTWIAWGDGDADPAVTDERDCVQVPPEAADDDADDAYTLRRIWLDEDELDAYYYGYSNRVLWPCCHERPNLVDDRPGDFEGYRAVNQRFAEATLDHAGDDDLVWLQDYHLGLAPATIRAGLPDSATLGQFWHVPWPRPAVFGNCPHGRELLAGLLGNDLLGFHVDRWVDAFLDCVDQFLPAARVDRSRRVVEHDGATTRVVSTPMGVDASEHDRRSRSIDADRFERFRRTNDVPEGVAVGLGVDRLDYSKGIPERLAAIERLLDQRPGWRESFTYVQAATPSRTDIPAYADVRGFVRSEVERINDRFATDDWRPIVYTEAYLSRETLCALYRRADAMLVSSLLDGMNLVAQEYVAASVDVDGALVLSDRVGAADLLGDAAYSIDPERTDAFAATLNDALTASPAERERRMTELRRRVFERDLERWMDDQFAELAGVADGRPPASLPDGGRAADEHPVDGRRRR